MTTLGGIGTLFGGIGLFLLGMTLMTDGLKLAGGSALKHLLADWTSTRLRGLLSGIFITSLVQSSSAVTIATIGFANAGLLTLGAAIWVIFGANIGTTVTGWLVALVGLNFKVESLALPLVGLGAMLHLLARRTRAKSLGTALAGFGLLFLGIGVMRDAFVGVSASIDLGTLTQTGLSGKLAMVALGATLTVVMMSSSAGTAVIITAAMSGIVPLPAAAAAIIGANVGTSFKAILAGLGATPNARRVAAAHVIFNVLTATVAFLFLPVFLTAIEKIWAMLDGDMSPAPLLAIFHTSFNIIGVLLMVPIEPRLTAWLRDRFRGGEDDLSTPRYLDRSTTHVPDIALRALAMELERLGGAVNRLGRNALLPGIPPVEHIAREREAVDQLVNAVGEFSSEVSRGSLPEGVVSALTDAVRVSQYDHLITDLALTIAELRSYMERRPHPEVTAQRHEWQAKVIRLLEIADPAGGGFNPEATERLHADIEESYHRLKQTLLRAGTAGEVAIPEMERQIQIISHSRRMAEQATKAARHMADLLRVTAPRPETVTA